MPMSEGIIFELQFFFSSFLLGVMMTIAYDGIRIFRRIFPHGGVIQMKTVANSIAKL